MAIAPTSIINQQRGRFDKRFGIGPACWPFYDLLWIHAGSVQLSIGSAPKVLLLSAPAGVLIFPDTPFSGHAVGSVANASICHFQSKETLHDRFLIPAPLDQFHVQNLIQLSLDYAQRDASPEVRINLLAAICDCFGSVAKREVEVNRTKLAWLMAEEKLSKMRGLSDVANLINLSESYFRALHRRHYSSSAGCHLQEMRFQKAEILLAATGDTIRDIAAEVGYAHAESFSAAFTKSRGKTPLAYRRWCKRFA